MGTKRNHHAGGRDESAARPKTERAAERVSDALESGLPEEDLDPADAERTAEATASPQPGPDEDPGLPRRGPHRSGSSAPGAEPGSGT